MWSYLLMSILFFINKSKADDWDDIGVIFDDEEYTDLLEIEEISGLTLDELMVICNFYKPLTESIGCPSTIVGLISTLQQVGIYNFNTWYLDYLNILGEYQWQQNVLTQKHYDEFSVFPEAKSAPVNDDQFPLYYRLFPRKNSGRSCKTPLVLLSAWGAVKEDWYDIAPFLSASRDVLTIDYRGIGQSADTTLINYTPEQYARDVRDLVLHVFNGTKPVLVGGTLGGKIALQSALDYGSYYAGIAMSGTNAGGIYEVAGDARNSLFQLILSGAYQIRWYSVAEYVYTKAWADANVAKWVFQFVTGATYNRPYIAYKKQYTIASAFDVSKRIEDGELDTTLPILLMHGTADRISNINSSRKLYTELQSQGAQVILKELQDLGHVSWHQNQTLFIDAIEHWVKFYVDSPCSKK